VGDPACLFNVRTFLPASARLCQRPRDEKVSIRRIVDVGDVRRAVWNVSPRSEAVPTHHQSRLGPLPKLFEHGAIVGANGKQHSVALALAVAYSAIGVVDKAAVRS
jgi:hypothetical protein